VHQWLHSFGNASENTQGSFYFVERNLKLRATAKKLFPTAPKDFLKFEDQTDRKQSLIDLLDESSPSGFSIYEGYYPICWRGLTTLLGVSNCLLQTVQSTPKARNRPCAKRPCKIGHASKLFVVS
jgi:hypothetical protein